MLPKRGALAAQLGLQFEAVNLHRMREVIITITPAPTASLMATPVSPGTHLACTGTDTGGKQKVELTLVAGASVFTDEIAQRITIGEAQHAVGAGLLDARCHQADRRGTGRRASGAAKPGRDHAF
jgi:ornithine cyclodeaminase